MPAYSICQASDQLNPIYWTSSYEQAIYFISTFSQSNQSNQRLILMKNCAIYQVFQDGMFVYGYKYSDANNTNDTNNANDTVDTVDSQLLYKMNLLSTC